MEHLCHRCAAASLAVSLCVCVCEQVGAQGLGQLQQPPPLRQHPCIHMEWHRPRACRDKLKGTQLLASVQRVWHEQAVLPQAEGSGSLGA